MCASAGGSRVMSVTLPCCGESLLAHGPVFLRTEGSGAETTRHAGHKLSTCRLQDAVVHRGKFIALYKRPGQRVIINAAGDVIVRPVSSEVRKILSHTG